MGKRLHRQSLSMRPTKAMRRRDRYNALESEVERYEQLDVTFRNFTALDGYVADLDSDGDGNSSEDDSFCGRTRTVSGVALNDKYRSSHYQPPEAKRRCPELDNVTLRPSGTFTGQRPTTSLLCLSRLLNEYFKSSNGEAPSSNMGVSVDKENSNITLRHLADKDGGAMSKAFSSPPFSLGEAIAFSDRARLLVESSPPYRVVHANAAYARWKQARSDLEAGTNPTVEHPPTEASENITSAVRPLFAEMPVTLFPVKGDEGTDDQITHFLVERMSCSPLPENSKADLSGEADLKSEPERKMPGGDISLSLPQQEKFLRSTCHMSSSQVIG